MLVIKKKGIFFRNQWKVADYTGGQKNYLLVNIQRIVGHFWRPQQKTDANFSNQFKKLVV